MKVRDVLPRDAIRSIDDPAFGDEYFGPPDDEVVVVEGDGGDGSEPARAYPVRILSHHEVVNDEVAGRPVAVTWCPICWSAVVYDAVVDGRSLTFGVSGKLADDALVLYDRETGSEWKQPTGEGIAGEFEGRRLEPLAAPVLTYERFEVDHPDGVVLQPVSGVDDGRSPADTYDMAGYERYVESEEFGLYGMRGQGERRTWDRTDLAAKSVVYGVEFDGAARAYPVERVETAGGVVTDVLGDRDLVVFVTDDGVGVFEHPGYEFEPCDPTDAEGNERTFRADGTTWDGTTGESRDGRELERLPARQMFAFAWQDAHGPAAFWEP